MWKGAEPDVEVFIVRHPESKANVDDANYGNTTPLSEKGMLQLPFITTRALELGIDCMVSSEADRAIFPVLDLLEHKIPARQTNQLFNEFRRPVWTVGRSNKEPDVAKALKQRIEQFGPDYIPHDGEEGFEETVSIITSGLDYLLGLARDEGFRRILLLTHGLRARMYYSWVLSERKLDLFAHLFRATYHIGGYENGGFMHLWYGYPFRQTEKRWNLELANSTHIPLDLR